MSYHYSQLKEKEKVFKYLVEIENSVKTYPNKAVIEMRQLLEIICKTDDEISHNKNLFEMLNELVEHYNLPKHVEEAIHEVRKKGNKIVHIDFDEVGDLVTSSIQDAIETLGILHKVLKELYSKDGIELPDFNADMLPISKFYVIRKLEDNEKSIIHSTDEFLAEKRDHHGGRVEYIIRSFDLKNSMLFDHGQYVLNEIWHSTPIVPNFIAQFEKVEVDPSTGVAYSAVQINNDMIRLDRLNILELTDQSKKEIFVGIFKGIKELQKLKEPITHRMLAPCNVMITKFNGSYYPKITNFEYSKVKNPKNVTVKPDIDRLRDGNQLDEKYIAPEVGQGLEVNYKADVYSLGKIILNLWGVERDNPTDRMCSDAGMSKILIDLVNEMIEDDQDDRVTLNEIETGLESI